MTSPIASYFSKLVLVVQSSDNKEGSSRERSFCATHWSESNCFGGDEEVTNAPPFMLLVMLIDISYCHNKERMTKSLTSCMTK